MDKAEKLMADFQGIDYTFEPAMPDGLKGLCIDDQVYLNPRQSPEELTETVAEEIAHYLTVLVISPVKIRMKNESKSRRPATSVPHWSSRHRILLTAIRNIFRRSGNVPII